MFVGPILAVAIIFLLFVQIRRPRFFNSGYREVMGTFAQITVAAKNKRQAADFFAQGFGQFEKVQRLMNDRDPNSELSMLSAVAVGKPVSVSPELFDVIQASVHYSQMTDGAFDITVGPLTKLWRQTQQTGQPPSDEMVAAAKEKIGYQKIHLDPSAKTIQLEQKGMKLDLGAIAKGYAVDLAERTLKGAGAKAGMVDLGGNIRCFGAGPGRGGAWLIGVQDPRNDEKIILTLRLNDMAAATSGDYRRVAVVNGRPYSHIINPKTAQSVRELAGVTVIAESAMQADALSTAISVLGTERGLALLESVFDVEGILIAADGETKPVFTKNAKKFIVGENCK